jgi:hypothetical protein
MRGSDLAVILGLGGLAYWLYTKVGLPGAAAASAATTAIASVFPGTSSSVVVQGSVLLPNGQNIPMGQMVNLGFQPDGSLQMSYGGSTYVIISQGDGTYYAQLAGLGSVDRFRSGLWR